MSVWRRHLCVLAALLLTGGGARLAAQTEPKETATAPGPEAPLAVPESVEDAQKALETVQKRLAALQELPAPTTQPIDDQPPLTAEDVQKRLKAREGLADVLTQYREQLQAYIDDVRAVQALGAEPFPREMEAEIRRLRDRADELQSRIAEHRDDAPTALFPTRTAAQEAKKAIDNEYDRVNARTESVSNLQATRQETLAGYGAIKEEAQVKLAEAVAALEKFRKSVTTQPVEDPTRTRLRELEEARLVWTVALRDLQRVVLNERETLLTLRRDRDEALLAALKYCVRHLGDWRTIVREAEAEWTLRHIESERRKDLAEYEEIYWEARDTIQRTVLRLIRASDPVRRRYPEAEKNNFLRDVIRSESVWKKIVEGLDRYDGQAKRKRYEEAVQEIRKYEDELETLQQLRSLSQAEYADLLQLQDTVFGMVDGLKSRLDDQVQQLGDLDKRYQAQEARSLRSKLVTQYRPELERRFTEVLSAMREEAGKGLINRLNESIDRCRAYLDLLRQARDSLYWSHKLARDVGWFNADWKQLRSQAAKLPALWHDTAAERGDEAKLASVGSALRRWYMAASGVRLWLTLALAAFLGVIAYGYRRRARRWAETRVEPIMQAMREQRTTFAPVADRLALQGALQGTATAIWAIPLVTLLVAVWWRPWLGVEFYAREHVAGRTLLVHALLFIVLAGLSLAALRFVFGAEKARFRVAPCSNAVAAHFLQWGRALIWFSIVTLPLPLLLIWIDALPDLREYLLALQGGIVLLGVVLFLRKRQSVIRVIGRPQDLKYELAYRTVVRLYPLWFLIVVALLVLRIIGYGPLTAFVLAGAAQTLAAIVIAALVCRVISDVIHAREREQETSLAEEATPGAVEQESTKPPSLPEERSRDVEEVEDHLFDPGQIIVLVGTLGKLAVTVGAAMWIAHAWGLTWSMTVTLLGKGITLGTGKKITLGRIAIAIAILIGSIYVSRALRAALRDNVYERHLPVDRGAQAAINTLLHYFIVVTGLYFALSTLHVTLAGLAVILGGLGVGVGLATQPLTVNFFSGLMMFLERHIKVGDLVEVEGQMGEVQRVNMRSTVIKTFDNIVITVPNGQFITNSVINWSRFGGQIRGRIDVGVAYGSDTELVRDLLLRAAREHRDVLDDPEPVVWFLEFGDSSLNFALVAWFPTTKDRWYGMIDLRYAIDRLFREHGVEIPFPQRTLSVLPDTTLSVNIRRDLDEPPQTTPPEQSHRPKNERNDRS